MTGASIEERLPVVIQVMCQSRFWQSLLVHEETETETEAAAKEARLRPETVGRAADPRIVVPGTATHHTGFAFFWSCRVNHVFLRIITEPVLTPLKDIAVHVVKAPRICGEATYGRG